MSVSPSMPADAPSRSSSEEYRTQLDLWIEEMAVGRIASAATALAVGDAEEALAEFVRGNLEKRAAKLAACAGRVADDCPHLPEWIDRYVQEVASPAYEPARLDCRRMLEWLSERLPLSPGQRDSILGQRTRLTAEENARQNRALYLRFTRLPSHDTIDSRVSGETLLLLNPTCARGELVSRLFVGEDVPLPATIVSFASEGDVRTTLLDPAASELIRLLSATEPRRVSNLFEAQPADFPIEEFLDRCKELIEAGVVAIAEPNRRVIE